MHNTCLKRLNTLAERKVVGVGVVSHTLECNGRLGSHTSIQTHDSSGQVNRRQVLGSVTVLTGHRRRTVDDYYLFVVVVNGQRLRSLRNGIGSEQVGLTFAASHEHKLVKLGVVLQEREQFTVRRSLSSVHHAVVRTEEERDIQFANGLQHIRIVLILTLRALVRSCTTGKRRRFHNRNLRRAHKLRTLSRTEISHNHRRSDEPVVEFVVGANLTRLGYYLTISLCKCISAIRFTCSVRTAIVTAINRSNKFRRIVNTCLNG